MTSSVYDAAGNLVQIIDGNGNPIDYVYDSRNRIVSQSNALGNTTNYQYDAVGNLLAKQKPDGRTIAYIYDNRNRLTKVSYPDNTEKNFTFDAAGRLTGMANDNTSETREYDARGRLLATVDSITGRIDYGYDKLGNRIRMTDRTTASSATPTMPETG